MTTVDEEQTAKLGAMRHQKERVMYACETMPATAKTQTADVMAWLSDRGFDVPRQTASKHVNAYKDAHDIPRQGATAEQRALTPGLLAEMDAERGFVGTPQETSPAGVEGSYNMDDVTVNDFAPRSDAPVSPAVSTPPAEVSRPVAPSLPPVMSDPRRVAPIEDDAPASSDASRDTDAPVMEDASRPVPVALTADATPEDDASQSEETPKASRRQRRMTRRARAWSWASGKFIWAQYVLLLQVAAYGLYQVLAEVAGAPEATAIGGALGIELVGISLKMLSDRAESDGENYRVVRALLVASGVVAVGIGAANAWGHSQMNPEGDANPYVGAVLFGLASVAGYSMWTIRTALAHRARRRTRGQLEGPGIRVPVYVRERYGNAVADRAELLSRYNDTLSVPEYVEQARAELEAEAREARETDRRAKMRAALIEYTRTIHTSQLAADLDASRYSDDELSDLFSASRDEHAARRVELLTWMDNDKK